MARYGDLDALLENLKKQYGEELGWQCTVNMSDVGMMIEDAPTADVVPRADFADQKATADMCAEVIARQDKEIERLQDKVKRYKRYYFHHDYDKMVAEVLDELDRFINSNCLEIKDERGIKGYVTSGVHFAISDFKKKYTEGKNV